MIAKKKWIIIALAAIAISIGGFFLYLSMAFPEVRCEAAKHLDRPEDLTDCVTCHVKATVQVTDDWNKSKHGVMLVKCAVCHGEPDGKGAIPFMVSPDPMDICVRCHEPAIKRMIQKYDFDAVAQCYTCHPRHQNPMHGQAYENKIPTSLITLPDPQAQPSGF